LKLFMIGPSPYARKVMVPAIERGLVERIEPVMVTRTSVPRRWSQPTR
jgi:hypothetical protein